MKKNNVFLILSIFGVSLLSFFSCKPGLGDAIDTKAPAISISSPTDNFCVRDNFILQGTQSDDRGVTKITVSLKQVENEKIIYDDFEPKFKTVSDEKEEPWTCEINTVEKDADGNVIKHLIKDGTYTATVTAYDKYNQKNVATKTFVIDNTPPLVILDTPSSEKLDGADSFGQNFYLNGQVYDKNEIDFIDVSVFEYDEATSEISEESKATIKLSDIGTSLESETVADWETSEGQINYYKKIYGDDEKAGNKKFYFKLNSHDKARKLLPDGSVDSSDTGNTTSDFFFNKDEISNIVKNIKPSGIYSLISESFETEGNSRNITTLDLNYLEKLNSNKKEKGTFQLNPDNTPTYVIDGINSFNSLDLLDNSKFDFRNDKLKFVLSGTSSITVTFSKGLDKTALMPETFGVELIKADETGNIVGGGKRYKLLEPKYDFTDKENWGEKDYDTTKLTSNGDNYSATIPITLNEVTEGFYYINVYGYDQFKIYDEELNQIKGYGNKLSFAEGSDKLKNGYAYGLWIVGSDKAPSLSIYKDADHKLALGTQNIGKGKDLTIYGIAKDESGQGRPLKISFYKDEETVPFAVYDKDVSGETNGEANPDEFEYKIEAVKFEELAGELTDLGTASFKITVSAQDKSSGLTTSKEVNISYDNQAPVIESIDILPNVEVENAEENAPVTVNGKITVKPTVSDASSVTISYKFGEENSEEYKTEYTVQSGKTSFEIDTIKFEDKKEKKLTIFAKDIAGNISSETVVLFVNQETDAPTIEFTNGNKEIKDVDGIKQNEDVENIFGKSNNKIQFVIKDDDGFEKDGITLSVQKLKYENGEYVADGEPKIQKQPTKETTSVNLNYSLPDEVSAYKITIIAKDKKSETKFSSTEIKDIFVVYDNENPSLKINNYKIGENSEKSYEKVAYSKSSQKIIINGSASDDSNLPVEVKRYDSSDIEDGIPTEKAIGKSMTISDGTWTDEISSEDVKNDKTYTYIAADMYGKTTNTDFVLKIDDTLPQLKDLEIDGSSYNENRWFKSTAIQFKGKVEDAASGIDVLNYQIENADSPKTGSITVDNEGSFSTTLNSFKESNGEQHNTIIFTVKDNAGNVYNHPGCEIKIDTVPPTVNDKIEYYFEGKSKKSLESVILSNGKKSITITGTCLDSASGLARAELIMGEQTETCKIDDSGNWTSTITEEVLSKMKENSIAKVRIYDNAGNFADSKTFTIKIDKTAPKVSITSPTENATLNETVKIEGKVEEDNTPLSVEIYSYVGNSVPQNLDGFTLLKKITTQQKPESESADEKNTYGASVSDIYTWKFEQNVNELLNSTEMKNDLYLLVVAYDEAGNCNIDTEKIKESDYKKYVIDKDSDRPIIKFSTLTSASGNIIKNNSTINGSIEDDDGVFSVLKISPDPITEWASYIQPEGTLSYSSGSFTYTPKDNSDGEKKMYFYIKDSAENEFYTNASEKLSRPYVSFKTETGYSEKEDNDKEISFTLDSSPADVGTPKYAVSSEESFKYKTDLNFTEMENKNLVGGKNKYIIFGVEATDNNGIESVEFSFDGGNDPSKITSQTETTPADGDFYATSAINLGEKDSGIITLTILVKDKSGFETTVQKQFTIDNDKPEVEIQNPATKDKLSTEELTGSVTLSGTAFDSLSTIEEIKYLILDDSYFSDKKVDTNNVEDELRKSEYTCKNEGTTAGWKFILENLPSGSFTEKDGTFVSDLSNYSKVETYSEAEGTKTLYYIPVYIYAKDSLGNENFDSIKLKYNPYGDRPSVEISETSPGKGNNKNTNGSIQINGSAEDNVSVKGVYIQIDANKDGKFDDEDIKLLKELKNGSEKIYTIIDEDSIATESGEKTPNYDAIKYNKDRTETIATREKFWGIKVNGTNSWNITINKAREFQNENTSTGDGTYQLSYRIIAVDNNYKFGSWSETYTFTIDTNVPEISSEVTIVGYSNEARTEQTSSRKYTSDMYLVTNENYNELQVIVSDKSDIKKVEYYQADSLSELASVKDSIPIKLGEPLESGKTGYVDGKKSYLVKIPLDKLNNNDNLSIQIVATKDNIAETTAYAKYSVKFDDDAPTIDYISYNGDKVSDATDASNVVENSNSVFTLGGQASDEGSGFARALFFYNRPANPTTGSKNRIYDPIAGLKTEIDLEKASAKEFDGQTMYGYEPSSVKIDENTKKTITIENPTEKFIYPRGVVYINGSWFTIEKDGVEKTGENVSEVTVETEIPKADKYDVFFPYARVIDNTGTEKGGFETSSTETDYKDTSDDGDGMPESVIKSQTQWTFDASIRSNFIPDGPGSITVFVFDNAGNCSAKKYDAKVQNNAPRLTKLWLGTDLSGEGTFEENEFTSYDVFAKTGTEQRTYEMNTADFGGTRFRILNKLALVTEFVGGNNAKNNGIKLAFNNDASSETEKCKTAESDKLISSSGFNTETIKVSENKFTASGYKNSTDSTKTLSKYAYVISKEELGDDSTGEINKLSDRVMSFTFWDDTEDSTQGKDSGYCYLKIKDLAVIQNDNFAPSVAINPFYWKSPEENSLYENNYLNGHIDLSRTDGSTLDKKLGLFVENGEPVLSENPKVSGKISITGSAIDEHSLASIWASFDGFTPSNGIAGGRVESKDIGESDKKTYYCVAKYDTKAWKTVTTENVSGKNWNFQILETSADQNGNLVTWQLDLDTSAITGAMGNNKNLSIVVFDAADSPHPSSLTPTEKAELTENTNTYDVNKYNVPSYTMDVVPYISGIKDANRSRLGKYPVRKGENVVITGFNFASSPTVYRKKTGEAENGEEVTVKSSTSTSITITAPEYSGYIYASWDVDGKTITTLNNENSNEVGYNIEEGYVAKDTDNGRNAANEAGTNFWTDDRYLSVWNVGTSFEGSINPHSGVVKKVRKTDTIWNGTSYTENVGVRGSSSMMENKTGMTDHFMGLISSDDMRLYLYDNTNKNQTLQQNNTAAFTVPPDVVDMVVLGGVSYYVLQTNYVGNSNAESWGPGLILSRDGFIYNKGIFETTKSLSEDTYQWIIEKHGNGNPATNRKSSTGYDSILYQFKNPRIAGWHTNIPIDSDKTIYSNSGSKQTREQLDYVYVSYYDNYAKCLKFAAFRSGTDFADGKITIPQKESEWGGKNTGDEELVAEIRSANGNMTTGATVVAGYDTTENNPNKFTEKAGEWSDIVVDTTSGSPIPVIVYYNETKKCLEVAQGKSKFPKSKNYGASSVEKLSGADAWNKSEPIRPTGSSADFGRYVSAAIDSSGNLHVAAQDATHSTLYYLYLKKSENSYTVEKSVLLDSASGAGLWTDIELTNPSGTTLSEIAPVVSYINSSYTGTTQGIKVAYISSESNSGDENIEFDAMTDPATWSAGNQRTSVMADVYEGSEPSTKAKIGVGFNSDMLAIDFLRGEE